MEHILTTLIFFPLFAAVLAFMIDSGSMRAYGITVTFIELILSIWLWAGFDASNGGMQFLESYSLISSYGINFTVGVDGISLFLVVLSTFMTFVALIGLGPVHSIKNMIISILILEMTMVGVFLVLDAIVFYLFWELSLVPMLYIIGAWGASRRIYAAV